MGRLTPLVRISLGLVVMTASILLTADMFGLLPRPEDKLLDNRIEFCERLAAHAAAGTSREDLAALRRILELTAARDEDLLSAGLREPNGRLILASTEHRTQWRPVNEEGSSATHVRIPLFSSGRPWATLEVRFKGMAPKGVLATLLKRPVVSILAFVMTTGFVGYLLYMRRTLRHLDPSAVVPTRVQTTLDVMAEGVVLIDGQEQIVLANSAFAEQVGVKQSTLMGKPIASFGWQHKNAPGADLSMPWKDALAESTQSIGSELTLQFKGDQRVFVVNAAPVLDGWDKPTGAIVTFDDVTELALRTVELERSNALLEKSQDEIQLQNQELEELSKRDPMTGVSNRRAFLELLDSRFETARQGDESLSCVMIDIDFFKRVNDDHGHSVGDEVIKRLATCLRAPASSTDWVCRWGGEEFIVLFPESIEFTAELATKLRKEIGSPGFTRVPVTASFGVATVTSEVENVQDLINRADAALYASKENGRNQVTRWDEMDHSQDTPGEVG